MFLAKLSNESSSFTFHHEIVPLKARFDKVQKNLVTYLSKTFFSFLPLRRVSRFSNTRI